MNGRCDSVYFHVYFKSGVEVPRRVTQQFRFDVVIEILPVDPVQVEPCFRWRGPKMDLGLLQPDSAHPDTFCHRPRNHLICPPRLRAGLREGRVECPVRRENLIEGSGPGRGSGWVHVTIEITPNIYLVVPRDCRQ